MIQIKRGSTKSWKSLQTKLAAGQPGYDKDKHKLKIGDGKSTWDELPEVCGLTEDEILDSEISAKARYLLNKEDTTIITYGSGAPDKSTIGKIYLQHYGADPEVDYIVDSGVDGIWSYQKWKSGKARCWGSFEFATAVQTTLGTSLYQNSSNMSKINYPFTFKGPPSEIASISSPNGLVWLASSKQLNTDKYSAIYNIISPDKLSKVTYRVSLDIKGFWK